MKLPYVSEGWELNDFKSSTYIFKLSDQKKYLPRGFSTSESSATSHKIFSTFYKTKDSEKLNFQKL